MLHPVIEAAARGELPEWARISERRRAHVQRVAALIGGWAVVLAPAEVQRWQAAGILHDAMKDAPEEALRALLPPEFRAWAEPLLHAPAAAEMLRRDGVRDDEMMMAITYHSLGHPSFAAFGRALYLADFIEPGRKYERDWLAALRARMPAEFGAVLREATAARICKQIEEGKPLRPETAEFWNLQVADAA